MKHFLWIALYLAISLAALGQGDNTISIGAYDSIHSQVLKEKQWIMVYQPESEGTQQKFPVLYVLDGGWRFNSAVAMVQEFGGSLIPRMIVVGVLNNNRFRDFSPIGTDSFASYMKKELFPYVEGKYPTAPHRTVLAHSLAGLFAANTMINQADLFNA